LPVLYTFRRCPYAIRARMALLYAGISTEQHEVSLKDKPIELITISPKATVPVLVLENGRVIDESRDIIKWALEQSDPDGWMNKALEKSCDQLIDTNDYDFKITLDKYKYFQNAEIQDPVYYREQARSYFEMLNELLKQHQFLLANQITFADIAIFPFIRQFYRVDEQWFADTEYNALKTWLHYFLNSEYFLGVMNKQPYK
jgi:glutathione S-transferase